MVRRSPLFAVLLATIIGCGEKKPSASDSSGTYTIKIREKMVGEKYEVTRTLTESKWEFTGNGKAKEPSAPSVSKVTTKAAYLEEVEAVDDGAVTKGKRKYSIAEGDDFGKPKSLSFVGKSVAFEAKGDKFKYTLEDGNAVPQGLDSFALDADTDRNNLKNLSGLLPEAAVKVGEAWEVPAQKLAVILGPQAKDAGFKASGKLEKAYTKDGKQFGVVTLKLEGTLNEKGTKLAAELTYDGCIDGSVTESTRKSMETIKAPVGGPGDVAFPDLVNSTERTIKPAK